ncbi:hypothetical protein [Helicobacter ailurogastricus]|uniref:Uncharacterized protein n=1 Tax=Helicobacter ailurogastricus TaxID=1578720 RepID=A0A0K2XA05_9HELI|nr:hypothetical protein [Helicobacter ailurogastricus]CRF43337.1 hypothetical protein HAL013_15690 [Helicobacter ailurogastricus]
MNVNAFKPNLRKLTFLSLGIGFLALTSPLSAENSGFYGSVGFQYSNMTQARGSNAGPSGVPMFMPSGNNAYGSQSVTNQSITLPGQPGSASSTIGQLQPDAKIVIP